MNAHPLFPPATDADAPPEVGSIRVYRMDGGRRVLCPKTFAAHELQSPETVFELFGGGAYLLQARSVDNARITANAQLDLAGTPRPLAPEPEPAPMRAAAGASSIDPTQLLLAVMNNQQQQNVLMVTMMQESSKQMVAMVTGMLSTTRADSQAMVQAMGAMSQAATNQQGELFKALLSAKEAPSAGGEKMLEAFLAGMEQAKEAGVGAADGISDKDLLQLAPFVLDALGKGKADAQAQQQAPRPLPPQPTPTNGKPQP